MFNNGHLLGFMRDAPAPVFPEEVLYGFEDNLNDSTGNGNTATAANGLSYVTPAMVGTKSASTDGSNQFIEVPANPIWDNLNGHDFTALGWIKSTDKSELNSYIGNFSSLTAVGVTPNQFWLLYIQTSGIPLAFFRRDNAAETKNTSATTDVCDGLKHLVAFIKRGLVIEVWVDGTMENSVTLSSDGNTNNDQPVRLDVNFGRFFNSEEDQVRMFDYAILQAEMDDYLLET